MPTEQHKNETNSIFTTTTLNIRGTCLDFQKREEIWIFYLQDCHLNALSSKKFQFDRSEKFLILICFRDAISSDNIKNEIIDQQIYESERWKNAGGVLEQTAIAFAIQNSATVRKQIHSISYDNIIVHFPHKTHESWTISNHGRAHFPLLHSSVERPNLTKCIKQEIELRDMFTETVYKKLKRRNR
jgi:hypothetical protein